MRGAGALVLATVVAGAGCNEPDGPEEDIGTTTSGGTTAAGSTSTSGAETTTSTTGPDTGTTTDATDGSTGEPVPPPDDYESIGGGDFVPLGDYTGMRGRVQILRAASGLTTIELHIEGLTASTAHDADTHRFPCDVNAGGSHYLIEPAAGGGAANEVQPGFTSNANGVGAATLTIAHAMRPQAQSIIVHDPVDDAKMLCADLLLDPVAPITRSGDIAPLPAAEAQDQTIGGTAQLVVDGAGATTLTVAVTGLTPTSTYVGRVHELPCDLSDGGGVYQRDPTGTAGEDNELWSTIAPDGNGDASDILVVSDHAARPDAESLVVHRTDDMEPAVACAPLVRMQWPDVLTSVGEVSVLTAGTDKGFAFEGDATMARRVDGTTTVDLSLTALVAGESVIAVVHRQSCALSDGGARYKINPAFGSTNLDNEMWLPLVADGGGNADTVLTFDHIARAEAMSIVVYDPADDGKIACIPLGEPS